MNVMIWLQTITCPVPKKKLDEEGERKLNYPELSLEKYNE